MTQFGSAQKRLLAKQLVAAVVLDAALAFAISYYFSDTKAERNESFWILLGAIWAAQIFVWVKNSIWNVVKHTAFNSNGLSETFLAGLHKAQMPMPEPFERSASDYFNRVSADEGVSAEKRAQAAFAAGWLSYPAPMGRMSESIYIDAAYEKALKAYAAGETKIA